MTKTMILLAGVTLLAAGVAVFILLALTTGLMASIGAPLGPFTVGTFITPIMILACASLLAGIFLLIAGLKSDK